LVNAEIASRNIAAKYLKNLESIGILKSIKEGREMIYINIPLFNLLKEN
jgi:ribosomal protein S19E (S16A)